jgi:hypothetical protein
MDFLPGPEATRIVIDAEQHRLAIDHERARAALQCGLGEKRIAFGPVVAVAGEQPHALALALDDQAIAVMLDFVNPVRARGNLGSAGRNAGLNRRWGMSFRWESGAKLRIR